MKRCILIPSLVEGQVTKLITSTPSDLILCADGGLVHALRAGLIPHAVIGDMDSLAESGFKRTDLPDGILWIDAPRDKDMTDTALCMDYALSQGCDEIVILGGLGGRFDHTFANLQNMVGYQSKGVVVRLLDQNNQIHIVTDGVFTLPAQPGFSVSVFSWTSVSTGVTLTGMAYPLTHATLRNDDPLGVSNEIISEKATIEVLNGTLLVVCSKIAGL